jgi:hypothetical protein
MSAKLEDFDGFNRQDSFPRGVELSLRWTMSAETPKRIPSYLVERGIVTRQPGARGEIDQIRAAPPILKTAQAPEGGC